MFRLPQARTALGRIVASAALSIAILAAPAQAHDSWANGKSLPTWLKQYCCSISDVHRYSVRDIWHDHAGWHLPDLPMPVPDHKAQASEDEFVWAFFPDRVIGESEVPPVWCFFIPQGSV